MAALPPALRAFAFALAALAVVPAAGQPAPTDTPAAALAPAPAGTRFGLLVVDPDGRELAAIDPDGRFLPASNTKLLTTVAAYATMAGLDRPDLSGGASVRLDGRDVVLTGHGDARMSSAPDCAVDCLATLADAVAARTRRVRDVIGDASLLADERWSPGMSWNNIQTRSGTGIAALSVDDNELLLTVTPGRAGAAPTLSGHPYYAVTNRAVTVADGPAGLTVERMVGSRELVLSGRIPVGAAPATLRQSIDDPAHYAAWRLAAMLRARGVRVTGAVRVRRGADPRLAAAAPLARLVPAPLAEDIDRINKASQNVHAELLLRRIGLTRGDGSIAGGVAGVAAMMARAGAPRTGWDISDGSGMSAYNRLSPRATIALLRWAAMQPWGDRWRASLPIAGVDGTLANRFRNSSLAGRLFAKTGSLNATNALSGYLRARSGRLLTFAFFANDIPGDGSATALMDAALVRIAEAN